MTEEEHAMAALSGKSWCAKHAKWYEARCSGCAKKEFEEVLANTAKRLDELQRQHHPMYVSPDTLRSLRDDVLRWTT